MSEQLENLQEVVNALNDAANRLGSRFACYYTTDGLVMSLHWDNPQGEVTGRLETIARASWDELRGRDCDLWGEVAQLETMHRNAQNKGIGCNDN